SSCSLLVAARREAADGDVPTERLRGDAGPARSQRELHATVPPRLARLEREREVARDAAAVRLERERRASVRRESELDVAGVRLEPIGAPRRERAVVLDVATHRRRADRVEPTPPQLDLAAHRLGGQLADELPGEDVAVNALEADRAGRVGDVEVGGPGRGPRVAPRRA